MLLRSCTNVQVIHDGEVTHAVWQAWQPPSRLLECKRLGGLRYYMMYWSILAYIQIIIANDQVSRCRGSVHCAITYCIYWPTCHAQRSEGVTASRAGQALDQDGKDAEGQSEGRHCRATSRWVQSNQIWVTYSMLRIIYTTLHTIVTLIFTRHIPVDACTQPFWASMIP